MAQQALRAIEEADRVLFLVDAREGLAPSDHFIAQTLRKLGKQVIVVANKAEGLDAAAAAAEFHQLGLGEPQAISSAHGDGVRVIDGATCCRAWSTREEGDAAGPDDIRVAVIGRPNVGKSTLINRLLGEERLITFDQPGTTRDAVFVPFERDGRRYTLIDTAGVRRRARVEEAVEKFSVIKALQAVDSANVVIGVIDAHDTVAEQDASLFGMVAERGRALIIAVNKWDGIPMDKRDEIRAGLDLRLPFLDFAPVHFISALHGTGVGELMRGVSHAYDASMREMPTPELTRVLETRDRAAPAAAGARPAHQAALRAPGRAQSADHRRARQPGAARPGCLSALSRERVSQALPAGRHAGAGRVPRRRESVQGQAQPAHAAPGALAPAPAEAREALSGHVCMPQQAMRAKPRKDYTDRAMATARKILKLQRPFPMRRGGELPSVEIAYETWGDPAVRHDNAVLIFTGLSPSAHAASSTEDPAQGWWEDMIGPGRPIDTRRFFVICVNSLGSPFGSTSPISINPDDRPAVSADLPGAHRGGHGARRA